MGEENLEVVLVVSSIIIVMQIFTNVFSNIFLNVFLSTGEAQEAQRNEGESDKQRAQEVSDAGDREAPNGPDEQQCDQQASRRAARANR